MAVPKRPKIAPDAPSVPWSLGAEVEHHDRAGDPAGEVQREEPGVAEEALQHRTEDPQRVHVEQDVQELGVQEDRGEQPPPTALVDAGVAEAGRCQRPGPALGEHDRLVDDLDTAEPRQHEDDDVDGDQRHRDPAGGLRDEPASDRAWLALRAGALGNAVGAVETHRRRPHAVGTDRPATALAPDPGLPVGVPVAARRRLRLRIGRWGAGHLSPDDARCRPARARSPRPACHRGEWGRSRSRRRPPCSRRRPPHRRWCA